MRRTSSMTPCWLNCAGAVWSLLSMVRVTSAWLREGREPVPLKITSSMPPARMALAELAPITQRKASRRFDLPQPFGPTMPVSPGSIRNSVGSTKDLNPERRSLWKCTGWSGLLLLGRGQGLGVGGVDLGHGQGAFLVLLAVDHEGRRALDVRLLLVLGDAVVEVVQRLLVADAGHELVLVQAGGVGDPQQHAAHVAGLGDLVMAVEDRVDDAEVLVLTSAARQQGAGRGQLRRRGAELAEHVPHLAGVDVLGLEGREDFLVPGRAVTAGHRGVLDHGHRRVGLAQAHVVRGDGGSAGRAAGGEGQGAGPENEDGAAVEAAHVGKSP